MFELTGTRLIKILTHKTENQVIGVDLWGCHIMTPDLNVYKVELGYNKRIDRGATYTAALLSPEDAARAPQVDMVAGIVPVHQWYRDHRTK